MRDQVGAAAVEFALCLVPFTLLVFGCIEFGYLIHRDNLVGNVSRDGVRVASLGGTYSQIKGALDTELAGYGLAGNDVSYTIDCLKADGTACNSGSTKTVPGNYDAVKESGGTAIITVTYIYHAITPVGSTFFGSTMNLKSATQMRIE